MFLACSMSRAAPSRTSPTMIQIDRIRSVLRTASRTRDLAAPLQVLRSRLEPRNATTACRNCSSAASSMVTIRSSAGTNEDSTFSVVVLPEPVPPLITTFSRPCTQARSSAATGDVSVPNEMRSSVVKGSAANFLMVSSEPSRAMGGTTALTRLPSGRRASTMGLDSSTRRPTRDTILSIVRRRWASSVKPASTVYGQLAITLGRTTDRAR